jgi:hypothetical protein
VEADAAELAGVLASRGPDGELIYSNRDVAIALALLFALEPGEPTFAARVHLRQVYRWAGVADTDPAAVAKAKIDRYLEAEPLHPALLRQFQRILRRAITALADRKTALAVGTDWAIAARKPEELNAARGRVLMFRLEQGRSRK